MTRKQGKTKTVRVRVLLPRGAGPWLYVDGEYAQNLSLTRKIAGAFWFPGPEAWETYGREHAWYEAFCYFVRGKYGAKEVEVMIEVPS
jgi:hypothetical protein